MSVGENPKKIFNIIAEEGSPQRFVDLYNPIAKERFGIDLNIQGTSYSAMEDAVLHQEMAPPHRAKIFQGLPSNLKHTFFQHADRVFKSHAGQRMNSVESLLSSDDGGHEMCKVCLNAALATIISRTAKTQAIKGIFTAGVQKATVYALAKVWKRFSS